MPASLIHLTIVLLLSGATGMAGPCGSSDSVDKQSLFHLTVSGRKISIRRNPGLRHVLRLCAGCFGQTKPQSQPRLKYVRDDFHLIRCESMADFVNCNFRILSLLSAITVKLLRYGEIC